MIDSHAHITSEYYEDIDELINYLKENNVLHVVNCSTNLNDAKEVIELSKKYNNFLMPAIGIHPQNIENINDIKEVEKLINENKIYAIGEIGLDYHWNKENKKSQKEIFIKQLELAEKYNLPVSIHTRDSIQDCLDILKTRKNFGIIHCFNGSYEMAKEFIKLGYKLGIGGVLTFKNSKLYELIEKIDLKDIVLETDSPFLTPEPYRGQKNNPYNIYFVAKRIAEIKNISIDEVIKTTTDNVLQLLKL